jgi:hypothetical protein
MRAGLPVRDTIEMTFTPPSGKRVPTGTTSDSRPQVDTIVAMCSCGPPADAALRLPAGTAAVALS